jgi:hypothetical protein
LYKFFKYKIKNFHSTLTIINIFYLLKYLLFIYIKLFIILINLLIKIYNKNKYLRIGIVSSDEISNKIHDFLQNYKIGKLSIATVLIIIVVLIILYITYPK